MSSTQQYWASTSSSPPLVSGTGEIRWYALYTRARHEKKVTTELQEKGLTAFLPLISERHRWSDRNKIIQVALFPCYTFVRLEACPERRLLVLKTPGVFGFVGVGGVGLPIPDKEIEDIQTLLANDVACALYPFMRVGKRVRIRGGCLEGVEGILVGKNSDQSLIVSVQMIQRSVAVRIDGFDVEPV